jgi:uncharacterized protein involved in exopolysaccharide biosynthesis
MISFFDLLVALRQRIWLAIVVGGTVAVLIGLIALVQPRLYSAGSSVLVDLGHTDPTDDDRSTSIPILESVIGTQLDIMRSGTVLGETARELGMVGKGSGEKDIQVAVAHLRKNLTVATGKESNVIRLAYTDKSAEEAARTINTLVDVFLKKQVELRNQPATSSARWFNDRTSEVRNRYEEAQKRLSDFQRQHGIVGVDRMDLEGDKVRSLSVELVQAQGEVASARSRAGTSNGPDVVRTEIVQNMEREVGMQSAKVAELSRTYGPNHPQMAAATAQLDQLRRSLAEATSTQAQSLTAASTAAQRREAELRARLQEQQAKMIALSGVQDQVMVLQRDVDAARLTYDEVRKRFNEATLKSEISQANTSRLDRAEAPILPAKPNMLLWLAAAIIMGAASGFGVVALKEALNPHVRTVSSTQRLTDLEVIVDMTSDPVLPGWLQRLFRKREFA